MIHYTLRHLNQVFLAYFQFYSQRERGREEERRKEEEGKEKGREYVSVLNHNLTLQTRLV